MKQYKLGILSAFLCCFILLLSACGTTTENVNTGEIIKVDELLASDSVVEVVSSETTNEDINKSSRAESKLKVHYIDVGQGDSSFIEFPNGKTMLIDAGIPSQGYVVTNYIKNLGYTDIDYVVATHPHEDHIGGLPTILDNFKVETFYMPNKEHTTDIFMELLNSISSNGCKAIYAKSGVSVINEGNLKVSFVAPISSSYSDLNNYSAIVKIDYKDSSFLFTGDAESVVESELLSSGQSINADILKVGHHGSNYSSTTSFLSKVKPKHAIISVGGNNYGHPAAGALSRLNDIGASIYRTDEVGTIIVATDGATYTIDKNATTIKSNAPPEEGKTDYVPVAPSQEHEDSDEVDSVQSTPTDVVVYVTRTGSKYHRYGCSYLKSCIETTLSSAKSSGYGACSRCNPPR